MAERGFESPAERALFVSDIHLSAAAPDTAEWFFDSLTACAPGADDLFILGDLFDVWLGDDAHLQDPLAERLARLLSALAAQGTRVWLMHGNRDFLMDVAVPPRGISAHEDRPASDPAPAGTTATPFSTRCAARRLPDPVRLVVQGRAMVLTHGDQLCTDDQAYQAWRATCRDPEWQRQFLSQPQEARLRTARAVRTASELQKQALTRETTMTNVMDVNAQAVRTLMSEYEVDLLIHGHTHRPARHEERWQAVNGERAAVRWVLPDWDYAGRRGGFLELRQGCLRMLPSPPAGSVGPHPAA